jgi:hypothetical protein
MCALASLVCRGSKSEQKEPLQLKFYGGNEFPSLQDLLKINGAKESNISKQAKEIYIIFF